MRELRTTVAARMRELTADQAGAPSWCEGWRVRDVAGHLVHLAEARQLTMARDILTHGVVPDRALSRIATALGDRPVAELADRLEAAAAGRFHIPGSPPAVALGEVVVHGADMFRPLGMAWDVPGETVRPVLPTYRRVGRLAFHGDPGGVRLVATDVEGQEGEGPEVRGRAVDLVLLLAHRRQVVGSLAGPGVAQLA